MNTAKDKNCERCVSDFLEGASFCAECGKLSPAVVAEGNLALEIDDVPSEKIRDQAVSMLNAWFPQLEPIRSAASLKAGRTILISGIDDESAKRILEGLEALKVRGRPKLLGDKPSWLKWIWNPGLAVSALGLILAAAFGGWPAFFLIVIALGAPVAVTLLKGRGKEPLIHSIRIGDQADQWIRLSEAYTEVLAQLSSQDSENLKALVRKVFRLQKQLKSESLASVAAGLERGDLYQSLGDALRSAVELSRRISTEPEEKKEPLRNEIAKLNELADRTTNWFRRLDDPVIKNASVLEAELNSVSESIDRIVREVRPLPDVRLTSKEKITP